MAAPPSFDPATIEGLAYTLGDLYKGSVLTRLFQQARVEDPLGEGATKWKRVAAAPRGPVGSARDRLALSAAGRPPRQR